MLTATVQRCDIDTTRGVFYGSLQLRSIDTSYVRARDKMDPLVPKL
jgi:hypothetical protein